MRSTGDVIVHEMGHVLGIGSLWTSVRPVIMFNFEFNGTFGASAYCREVHEPPAHRDWPNR